MRFFKKWRVMFGVAQGILLLFVSAGNVLAHDVIHDMKLGDAVVLRVGYDTGEPMQYAEVLIYSPKNDKIEFQNGRTDANGSFAFLPDTPGEWRIVVDDGDGHGMTASFLADKSMNIKITRSVFDRVKKLLAGLVLILGFTGFLYYMLARKMAVGKNR